MSSAHPGIGFWNHTVPSIPEGGTWSQDVLWLDPLTTCVNNNITIEYIMDMPDVWPMTWNITDHGGFYGLPHSLPPLDSEGQNVNLGQRAYLAAISSNAFNMRALNITRNSTVKGKTYSNIPMGSTIPMGRVTSMPLGYFNTTANEIVTITCRGFGYEDNANATNVQVSCGAFLGRPLRTDGGNQREFDEGSRWTQGVYTCASATRASIQRTTTNDTSKLQNLRISRQASNVPVLWAVEKTNISIGDIDLMWGRVDDKFEDDSSLWTTRSEGLYLPAGSMGQAVPILFAGVPQATYNTAWSMVYDPSSVDGDISKHHTGNSDYAMKAKFQSLTEQDPTSGNAQTRNIMWIDFMANNVFGTATNSTVMVAHNQSSLAYDLRFAIPGFILFAIWVPSFFTAIALVIARKLKFEYVRKVLNHTSLGRVVLGTSSLRLEPGQGERGYFRDHGHEKGNLVGAGGATRVVLDLDRKGTYESLPRETQPL